MALDTVGNRHFWSTLDARVSTMMNSYANRRFGRPRSRYLTVTIPLANATLTPATGWLTSLFVNTASRVIGWQILALVPGTITLDIQNAVVPASPGTPPTLVSLPGAGNHPSLNGYGVISQDTTAWAQTDVEARSTIHIQVLAASGILQAVLGLTLMDLDSRVLQT